MLARRVGIGEDAVKVIDKLFSFRAWLLCALMAALIAAVAGAVWSALAGPVFVIAFVVILGTYVLNPATAAVCPSCRKRVKFGAERCHHCGQLVA